MSAIRRIATLLAVSDLAAQLFCAAVQRKCKGYAAPPGTILMYLQRAERAKRSPDAVAAAIMQSRSTSWRPGTRSQPAPSPLALRKKRDPGTSPRSSASSSGPAAQPPEHYRSWEPDESPRLSPILRHDPRDATAALPKCPHGVLRTRKCAICDPEGFRRENGELG